MKNKKDIKKYGIWITLSSYLQSRIKTILLKIRAIQINLLTSPFITVDASDSVGKKKETIEDYYCTTILWKDLLAVSNKAQRKRIKDYIAVEKLKEE